MRWLLRAAVAASIALAGALWVAAAVQRWWPACKRGDFDAVACLELQDHLYDYVAPTAPWAPVGSAAQIAGVAMALLGAGVTLLPWLWLPRRPLVCLAVAVPALAVLLIGGMTWNAELSHEALHGGVVPTILVWSFGLPVVLAMAAATSRDHHTPQRTTRWRAGITVLIATATPLGEVLFAPLLLGYLSHDSTPWTGAVTGVLLMAAVRCVAVDVRTRSAPRAPRTSAGSAGSTVSGRRAAGHGVGLTTARGRTAGGVMDVPVAPLPGGQRGAGRGHGRRGRGMPGGPGGSGWFNGLVPWRSRR